MAKFLIRIIWNIQDFHRLIVEYRFRPQSDLKRPQKCENDLKMTWRKIRGSRFIILSLHPNWILTAILTQNLENLNVMFRLSIMVDHNSCLKIPVSSNSSFLDFCSFQSGYTTLNESQVILGPFIASSVFEEYIQYEPVYKLNSIFYRSSMTRPIQIASHDISILWDILWCFF